MYLYMCIYHIHTADPLPIITNPNNLGAGYMHAYFTPVKPYPLYSYLCLYIYFICIYICLFIFIFIFL